MPYTINEISTPFYLLYNYHMPAVTPLTRTYDEYLVKTHADKIEIFREDITNPIVTLPIAFAKAFAADLCLHTPGADVLEEAPVLELLNLQTDNFPSPGLDIMPLNDEPTIYQCPVEIDSLDSFTGLTMHVACDGTISQSNVDVKIDGVTNGHMATLDGLVRAYVPGTAVVFAE